MATSFTNVEEIRRGKGNKKSRLAPRVSNVQIARTMEGKKDYSPDVIAVKKLKNTLKETLIDGGTISVIEELMLKGEQTRFMNMEVLAKVIEYLYTVGFDPNPDNFSYDIIEPYIDSYLLKKGINEADDKTNSERELLIIKLRMAATFVRYMEYIDYLRNIGE